MRQAIIAVSVALSLFMCNTASASTPINGTIIGNVVWTKANSPYIVSFASIPVGSSLTMEPGAIIKFPYSSRIEVYGNIIIGSASSSEKVVITSIKDDTVGGDTNGDGGASSPQRGDWSGVRVFGGNATITNAIFRYGSANVAQLYVQGGNTHVDRSQFTLGSSANVTLYSGTLTITNSDISYSNFLGVLNFVPGNLTIRNSSIHDNAGLGGAYNVSTAPIDLRENWWGAATGPTHPSNPLGTGDKVSDHVDFGQWLMVDPSATATPPTSTDPCTGVENCYSNVLFLPGLEASRLYEKDSFGFEHRRWEPEENLDVKNLFLDETGRYPAAPAFANTEIYTRDVIDEAYSDKFGVLAPNIYKSFIAQMNTMVTSGTINDWEAIPYDWRLAFGDILASGKKDGQNISYTDATTSPYIIQELRHLAAQSKTKKVTIIAHSNGGLLAKALMQQLGDVEASALVDKVIFVASPQSGTPQAIGALFHGYKLGLPTKVPLYLSPDTARALTKNFSSAYMLLPSNAYFRDVQTPVSSFDGTPFFANEFTQFGSTIENKAELSRFLLNNEGSLLRTNAPYDDTKTPAVLNSIVLASASAAHEIIDSWTPTSTIKVYQIAGWGIDTLASIRYKEKHHYFKNSTWDYSLDLTEDGDGTVVVPSALQLSTSTANVSRWWINLQDYDNLTHLGRDHADILEVDGLRDFIANIITDKTTAPTASYIATAQLTPTNTDKRLRFFLHSPLSLELYDSNGNHAGISTSTGLIDTQIPGAYYREFGEVKYITAPASTMLHLILNGHATGSFSLEIQEVQGDTVIATTTFVDIPSSTSTKVSIDFTDGAITNASPLRIDSNGDGIIDHSLNPQVGGEVTMPRPKLTLTPDNKTVILGATIPLITTTLSGFIDGDTASTSVTGSPVCVSAATTASSVGSFPITCTIGTLVSEKYDFGTFATGTLTIIYKWDGFLQPINDTIANPTQTPSVFKGGSTVPVKFQLKNTSGVLVQSSTSPMFLTPQKGSAMSAAVVESTYSDSASTGTSFKWDSTSHQYIYNWSTKGLAVGYWYRIYAKLDDGTTQSIVIGIR